MRVFRLVGGLRAVGASDPISYLMSVAVLIFLGTVDLGRRSPVPGQQPTPHTTRDDQPEAAGMHADPGTPVGIEQNIVVEGDVTHPAMRPHRPPPRRLAPRAGAQVGGRIIARHQLQ